MTKEPNAPLPEAEIDEAARLWAIRVDDPNFEDWDDFAAWLAGDQERLDAYETAVRRVDRAAGLLRSAPASPLQRNVEETPVSPRRWFLGGSLAASLAVAAGLWTLGPSSSAEQIATAMGERRTLVLADGSRVILNGGTRVTVDRDSPRRVALAEGEALFEIRHDASDPFIVTAGGTRLVDAGTVFNVTTDRGALDVEVAEGAVIYRPGADAIRLDAGQRLSRASEEAAPVVRRTEPGTVGAWRSGELHYDGASLERIARDLGRNLGRPVVPAPGIASMRFSGSLVLGENPDEALARAGPLLGVTFTANERGWIMSPADGPPR